MSKRSDPAAFARAAGAADPLNLVEAEADPAPTPDPVRPPTPRPESATALTVQPDDDDAPPEIYDPADYRWVPVRRKPRHDGWTPEKQRRFIETLADTGLVNLAAKAVGMTRESAYQLRRSEHGAGFARAWDIARQHAGCLIEDIAFERAIEGTEHEILNEHGEVVSTRLIHDNRMLKYLLSHLKPERYGSDRARALAAQTSTAPQPLLAEHLRAMEPALPAPPEQLLDPETLAHELELADQADGALPQFLSEQPRPKTEKESRAGNAAARERRGEAALKKRQAGGELTSEEEADECYYLDPVSNKLPLARRRQGT